MPVTHENVAVRSNGHRRGPVEGVRAVSGDSRLAQGHKHFSVRIEFEDLVALSVAALGIRDPNISLSIHKNAVWNHQHSRRKAFHKFSGRIEFQNGGIALAQAGSSAASLRHPDVVVAVQT